MTVPKLYPMEECTVACSVCKNVFFSNADVKQKNMGPVQFYNSVEYPVSGWIRCRRCKDAPTPR